MPVKKPTPKKKSPVTKKTSAPKMHDSSTIRREIFNDLGSMDDDGLVTLLRDAGYEGYAQRLEEVAEASHAASFKAFMKDVLIVANKHKVTTLTLFNWDNNDLYVYDALEEGIRSTNKSR